VSRRAALPGASELFRTTSSSASLAEVAEVNPETPQAGSPAGDKGSTSTEGKGLTTTPGRQRGIQRASHGANSAPSGRQRHDEKITVYLSSDELVALDDAKATLYRDLGMKVDRGRIVREAVAVVVADLQAKGEASIVARRLREGLDA
jgi:hypothetical protein